MARKKNKNKRSSAPAPAAQAFTDLEDEFFQTTPGRGSGDASLGQPPSPSERASSDTRPRDGGDVTEVAYDAALFDHSAEYEIPEDDFDDGAEATGEAAISSDSGGLAQSQAEESFAKAEAGSEGLPEDWINQSGGKDSLGAMDGPATAAYGGGFREDLNAGSSGFDPYKDPWSGETSGMGDFSMEAPGSPTPDASADAADSSEESALADAEQEPPEAASEGLSSEKQTTGPDGSEPTTGPDGSEPTTGPDGSEPTTGPDDEPALDPEEARFEAPNESEAVALEVTELEPQTDSDAALEADMRTPAEAEGAADSCEDNDRAEAMTEEQLEALTTPSEEDQPDSALSMSTEDDRPESALETAADTDVQGSVADTEADANAYPDLRRTDEIEPPGKSELETERKEDESEAATETTDDTALEKADETEMQTADDSEISNEAPPIVEDSDSLDVSPADLDVPPPRPEKAYIPTEGELQMVGDEDEEAPAETGWTGIEDDAELAPATGLDTTDPEDLPEPAAKEDDLNLPVADLPEDLGWNVEADTPAEEAEADLPEPEGVAPPPEEPLAPEAGTEDATEAPEPIWSIPDFRPEDTPPPEEASTFAALDASPTYATALRFEPQAEEAPGRPDDVLSLDDQFGEAIDILRTEVPLVEDAEPRAAYWVELGRLLLGKGQSEEAREALRESLNASEGLGPAIRVLTQLDRAEERWASLADSFETLALTSSDERSRAAALVNAAELKLGELEKPDEARVDLEEAFDAVPGNLYIAQLLEALYRQEERWEDVARILETMAERLPTSGKVLTYHRLAEVSANHLERKDAAREWYSRALELDPDFVPSVLATEQLLIEEKDHEALQALVEKEAKRHTGPAAVQAWLRVADHAGRNDQPDKVLEALRNASDIDNSNPFLRREYQGWLARSGDWETYVSNLNEELEHATDDSTNGLLLLAISNVYEHSLDKSEEALEVLERAIAACPNWQVARDEQLRLLTTRQDWEQLAGTLEGVAEAESDPRRSAARYFQTGLLIESHLSDPEKARFCFEKAARADAHESIYGWTLRRLLEDSGAWNEATQLVEEGILSWPFSGDAGIGGQELELAGVLAEFVHADEASALVAYTEAVKAGARSPIALGGYLRLLRRNEDWTAIVELLEQLEGEDQPPGTMKLLLWEHSRLLNEKLEESGEAVALLDRILESDTFLPALWARSSSAWSSGDPEAYRSARGREWEAFGQPADPELESLGEAMCWARRGHSQPFEALAADPDNELALDLHEWWLHETGDTESLSALFAKRLERPIDIRQACYLQLRRAAWLEQSGEAEGALVDVANAVAEGAQDAITLNRLERLSTKLNQSEQLQDLFRRMAEAAAEPTAELALRMARNFEYRLESPASALAEYRRASWLDSACIEALDGIIRLASQEGDHAARAEALSELAQQLENEDDQAVMWMLAGRSHLDAEDPAKAEAALSQALEHCILEQQVFDLIVELNLERADVDSLEALYQPWIERSDSPVLMHCRVMELGDQLEALGAIDQARERFEQLAATDGYLPAVLRLERLNLASEDWEGYVAALEMRSEAAKDDEIKAQAKERALSIRSSVLRDPWARETELKATLAADPEDDDALDAFRVLLATQERWTDLAVVLTELAESTTDGTRKVRRMLDASWIYANKIEDLEVAFDRYQDVLDISEGESEAIAALKEICERREDWNGMVATLARQSLTLGPEERIEAYREIASIWEERLDEPETAVESYRKVLELNRDDRGALTALTNLFRQLRQWPLFVDTAEHLLEVRRDEDPALLNEIGITLARRLDEPHRAVPFLLRASARGQGDLEVMRGVAARFEEESAWREAAELYTRVAELYENKDGQIALYQKVARIVLKEMGDAAQAMRCYNKILEIAPDHLPAIWELAKLYDDVARYDDALGLLDGLVAHPVAPAYLDSLSNEERVHFHRRYGRLLLKSDHREQAAAHFEAALGLEPGDQQLLAELALLYRALERWDKYAATLRMQLDAEPDLPHDTLIERLEALAKAYNMAGDANAALETLNQLKDLDSGRVEVYLLMADIYRAQRSWKQLLSVYNSVIRSSTEVEQVVDAYLRKADILDEQLSPSDASYVGKAVMHYHKALTYDKRNIYAMLKLAQIHLRERQFQKAADWLKRILAIEPSPAQLACTHVLGGILCAEGQKDPTTAMANFRKAAVASPSVEELLDAFASAVEDSPGNLNALLNLYERVSSPTETGTLS